MAAVQTHGTPNPNAIKFTREGAPFIESGLVVVRGPADLDEHPLGRALYSVRGVESVLIMPQFVTVTKEAEIPWDDLLDEILELLTP